MIFKFVVGFTFIVASVVLGLTPDSSEDDSLYSIFASMADDLKLPENYDEDWGRNPVDPDVGKDMVEIVKTRGYTIETHTVTTPDGYILTMFNVPHGKKTSTRNPKPVLLQHGLLDSSYTWVNNYEEQSLGFILADAGFDVWFGNNRGNRYGRSHTSMNPDDDSGAFWRFTWDEMASLDAPTMINFVTSYTNTSSLGWVGHSEGTIQMFAAGTITDKSSYVKDALAKVNLFVALAPVAYVHHLGSRPLVLAAHTKLLWRAWKRGHYEMFAYGRSTEFAPDLCRVDPKFCNTFFAVLMGPSNNLNQTRLQVYVSETPAGTSNPNLDHWAQGVRRNKFQAYDWGTDENQIRYGQRNPPEYDLSKFILPVALFYGDNDYLADPEDVQQLIEQLPASKIVYQNRQPDYAHCDFVWAPNAAQRIYPQVVQLLTQYSA